MVEVLLLVGLGVVLGKVVHRPEIPDVLDWWVINVALVAVVLTTIRGMEPSLDLLVPLAVAWATLALGAVIVLIASRTWRWSRVTTATLLLVVPLGNTSFLGFPALSALLGDEYLVPAVVFDQLGSFLALATYGSIVVAVFGASSAGRPRATFSGIASRLATFPPFVALVAAALSRPLAFPDVVDDVLVSISATLVPVVMVSIGMRLRVAVPAESRTRLAFGLSTKMLVLPAVMLAVALVVGAASLEWRASVVESAMPPMASAGALAATAGLDTELAASMVGYGVLLSMATLPLWAWIVTSVL